MGDEAYLTQLKAERDGMDATFPHALRLLNDGESVLLDLNVGVTCSEHCRSWSLCDCQAHKEILLSAHKFK